MADDHEKTFKKDVIERLGKAKGRLRQSFPEMQQLIKRSNVVEAARKIIDPAHSIFQQFADDVQLKDLLAKAEAIVVKANLTVAKPVSKDTSPAETFQNETPANVFPSKKAVLKKAPSKGLRPKKPLKKMPSKNKAARPLKRIVKTLS
jgi:hypothetical protein